MQKQPYQFTMLFFVLFVIQRERNRKNLLEFLNSSMS